MFWKLFAKKNVETSSRLQRKIRAIFPEISEKERTKLACIAGLFARVIHADSKITETEKEKMEKSLKSWTKLDSQSSNLITDLALTELKDLAGIENHMYCPPLNGCLNRGEKSELLKALFALAASDGEVDNIESEEIRLISKGLRMSHQQYIGAKITVQDKLKALK